MSAIQAVGDVWQGVFNRNAKRREASILRANAATRRVLGAIESDQVKRESQREVGAALARAGASGFTIDQSAIDVIADLAGQYGEQARYARYEASAEATRMMNDASARQAEGNMALLKGVSDAAGRIGNSVMKPGGGG